MTGTHEELLSRRTAELGVAGSDLEHMYQIFFGDLSLCGCGNPEEAWKLIHSLLRLFATKEFAYADAIRDLIGTEGACHFVLSMLDEAGLTEHGGSAWGSWLTKKGEWTLSVLDQLSGVDPSELFGELSGGQAEDPGPPSARAGHIAVAQCAHPMQLLLGNRPRRLTWRIRRRSRLALPRPGLDGQWLRDRGGTCRR